MIQMSINMSMDKTNYGIFVQLNTTKPYKMIEELLTIWIYLKIIELKKSDTKECILHFPFCMKF